MEHRTASVSRKTRETNITANLNLDGRGRVHVDTGVGFFDHVLTSAMVHGFFDLELQAAGDLHIDDHHTVEDVGIVLGQAFHQALGDFSGIRRFGSAAAPMDEALARADVDCSNRPFLYFGVPFTGPLVGRFDAQLIEEFWRAFTVNSRVNLHVELVRGQNMHHIFEAVFKACGRALDAATRPEPRSAGALSTKGGL